MHRADRRNDIGSFKFLRMFKRKSQYRKILPTDRGLWYNTDRYYTCAGPVTPSGVKTQYRAVRIPRRDHVRRTWYTRSTWRGVFEPSASHTCPLNEVFHEFSGHGIISITVRPRIFVPAQNVLTRSPGCHPYARIYVRSLLQASL